MSSDFSSYSPRSGGGVASTPARHPLLPRSEISSGVPRQPFVPAPSDSVGARSPVAPLGSRGTSLSLGLRKESFGELPPSLSSPGARSPSPPGPAAKASPTQPRVGGTRRPEGARVPGSPGEEREGEAARRPRRTRRPGRPRAPSSFRPPPRDCSGFSNSEERPLTSPACLPATRPPGWGKGGGRQLPTRRSGRRGPAGEVGRSGRGGGRARACVCARLHVRAGVRVL